MDYAVLPSHPEDTGISSKSRDQIFFENRPGVRRVAISRLSYPSLVGRFEPN